MFVPLLVGIGVKCSMISDQNTGGSGRGSEFKSCQNTLYFQALQYYNILALCILGVSLIFVTCMLQRRMYAVLGPNSGGVNIGGRSDSVSGRSGDVDEEEEVGDDGEFSSKFYYALCRMNVVMICCTVSFIIRAIIFGRLIQISNMKYNVDFEWKWLMYQEWIPASIPTLALLYLMRDVKKAGPIAMMKANHQNFNFGTPNTRHRSWGSMDTSSIVPLTSTAINDNDTSTSNGFNNVNRTCKIPGKYELIDTDVL